MLAPIAMLLVPLVMGHAALVTVKEDILVAFVKLVVEAQQVANLDASARAYAASGSMGRIKATQLACYPDWWKRPRQRAVRSLSCSRGTKKYLLTTSSARCKQGKFCDDVPDGQDKGEVLVEVAQVIRVIQMV